MGVCVNDLILWMSHDRLRPYLVECAPNFTRAVALYIWNAKVAAAFFEALGHFEVILRNAMHEQLSAWHAHHTRPGEWYDDPEKKFDDRSLDEIRDARNRLSRKGMQPKPSLVVAELNFGFWRFLLDQKYQPTLWAQALHRAFPRMLKRRRADVQGPVSRLHQLRNRIAHHEAIHHLDLVNLYCEMIQVVEWINPATARWLSLTCRRLVWLLDHKP